MTSAFSVSTRNMQQQWSTVHQDIPSNSVIVKNLSPATREETIIIHFQKKKNGGGEVERVRLLSEGVAVVTFEKSEVADSVSARKHEIDGALVTLERHHISCPDQVFGKVAGRLDPDTFGVSFSSMEGILRTIHDETKVEWKKIFDGFVVSGTFEQIKTVRELLGCHLQKKKEHQSERTPKDSRRPVVRDITTVRGAMVGSKRSTESASLRTSATCLKTIVEAAERKYNKPLTQEESQVKRNKSHGNHSLVENARVRVSENAKKLDQPEITSNVSSTRNSNGKTQIQEETEPQSDGISRPMPITQTVKKQVVSLENSKENTTTVGIFKTGVVDNASAPSRVSEIGNTSTNGKTQDQGEEKQDGDVKDLFTSVKKRETPLENIEGKIDRATQPKSKRLTGLLDKNDSCEDEQSKSTLFNRHCDGEKSTLIEPVLNEASDQENHLCCHLEIPKTDESLSREIDECTMEGNSLKYITSTGITVLLLKGDITSSRVDVLLSPANPTLSYKEGLSKLILEKGGQVIKDECHRIVQANCPLLYGTTFFTSSGNLPCRDVLHAVLPPWIIDNENEKALKLQIHRSLIDGLTLASGYRHRSVALPPLGQDWNCIPLEISAEVITRVIAKFSNNVGPMHSGINDIRIVCEDDTTINVFAKELTSFSLRGEKPYFLMAPSKNELSGAGKITKYQIAGRHKDVDSSIAKEDSVEQIQKATASPEIGSLPNKEKVEIYASSPNIETGTPSQLNPENAAILPVINEMNKGVNSSNDPKQCHESAITVISSSCTKSTDISGANAFEILEVTATATVALVEEVAKRETAQDNSSRELVKEFKLEKNKENRNERNGNVVETSELSEKVSAPKIAKAVTPEIQQPKLTYFSTEKEQNKVIPSSEAHHPQRSTKNTSNLDPLKNRPETAAVNNSNSSSLTMDNGLFVTSPTVEALLNADLRLGFQGLHIEHERHRNIDKAEDHNKSKKSFLTFKPKESNSTEHIVSCITTSNEKEMITEKYFQEDINENLQSKMVPGTADTGYTRKSTQKCDSKETDGKKYELEPALVDNDHNGNERKVSTELQTAFLCALCQDTVDHPDLIHPNVCIQHKFCDDCILKAFTFSNDCPVCVDAYGLIASGRAYNVAHNHTAGLDTKASNQSSPADQEGGPHWTAFPDVFKANQPPGQMMWKKYGDSVPGFEGCGTFAVTFTFYDGIQTSEHPSPGEMYRGMSCIAYLPDTQEGRQVLKLLWKAFDARLVFTVSKSALDPTGQVALNGVELKTSVESDARNGYPDHGYLSRVRKQLGAKGFQ